MTVFRKTLIIFSILFNTLNSNKAEEIEWLGFLNILILRKLSLQFPRLKPSILFLTLMLQFENVM